MAVINTRGLIETNDLVQVENSAQELAVSTLQWARSSPGTENSAHTPFLPDQIVRLMEDIPEFSLRCGDLGIVISTWCAPIVAYEVDFYQPQEDCHTRVLVLSEHLQAEPAPAACAASSGRSGSFHR